MTTTASTPTTDIDAELMLNAARDVDTASITIDWPGDERNANIDRLVSIGDQLCEGTDHTACIPGLCGEAAKDAAISAKVDELTAEVAKLRKVAQTYREAMVGQHEWGGHLIEGDCPDCNKAAEEPDGDLACDQYRQWQREYENALSTYVPAEVAR